MVCLSFLIVEYQHVYITVTLLLKLTIKFNDILSDSSKASACTVEMLQKLDSGPWTGLWTELWTGLWTEFLHSEG